jgi:hypothetical protein
MFGRDFTPGSDVTSPSRHLLGGMSPPERSNADAVAAIAGVVFRGFDHDPGLPPHAPQRWGFIVRFCAAFTHDDSIARVGRNCNSNRQGLSAGMPHRKTKHDWRRAFF